VSSWTTVVVSRHWNDDRSELGFVARSLAGAATRFGKVAVLVPGEPGQMVADGAFDVQGIGIEHEQGLKALPDGSVTIVDHLTRGVADVLANACRSTVFYVAADHLPVVQSCRALSLYGVENDDRHIVHLHVPVNPLATHHRHNGFGFTGYTLVLAGRGPTGDVPPPEVAWLTARFSQRDVIVVQDGTASAWRGRALRGRVAVDTRIDLWRLMSGRASAQELGLAIG